MRVFIYFLIMVEMHFGAPVFALGVGTQLVFDFNFLFYFRTAQGKAISAHVCSAIKASQAVGWTPLVVGGKSSCCR